MTNYVTSVPAPTEYPAFEVHHCDVLAGCWCFTSDVGHPYHGKHKAMRIQARALKQAAKAQEARA